MKCDKVIQGLQEGKNYTREYAWSNKVITLQIPADIPTNIIPGMTSLNNNMKHILTNVGDKQIHYRNQVLIVDVSDYSNNIATYYMPTWEDIFADDWIEV